MLGPHSRFVAEDTSRLESDVLSLSEYIMRFRSVVSPTPLGQPSKILGRGAKEGCPNFKE